MLCPNINTLGRFIKNIDIAICRQPLGNHDLLLVTAGQIGDFLFYGRCLYTQTFYKFFCLFCSFAVINKRSCAVIVQRCSYCIKCYCFCNKNAFFTSFLRNKSNPVFNCFSRIFKIQFLTIQFNCSTGLVICTKKSLAQFCLSSTYQTCQTNNFAFSHKHGNIFYTAFLFCKMFDNESFFSDFTSLFWKTFFKGTSKHFIYNFLGCCLLCNRSSIHNFTITHNRIRIADLQNFMNTVCDKNNRNILCFPQMTDYTEKFLRFRVRQRCRRLIQNQKITFILYSPRNKNHLFLSQSQRAAQTAHININIQSRKSFFGILTYLSIIYKLFFPHVHNHIVKHNVFCNRQSGDQCHIYFLVYNLNTKFFRSSRLSEFYNLSII